jgi:hypothetical protein
METQVSLDQEKVDELVNFLKELGAEVTPILFSGKNAMKVVSRKEGKWLATFVFYVKDNGETIVIPSFTLETDVVKVLQQGELVVYVKNEKVVKTPSVVFFNVEPIAFPLDDFLKRLLKDKLPYFLFYSSLAQRKEVSPKLVNDLASKLWQLS